MFCALSFQKQALAEASNVFRIRGEYANFEKLANQLIELDNDSFLGHYHAAYANFMLKKYDEAVRHYETALKIIPNHFAVLYELGEMYSHLGQDDKAYSYRELAKQYWPSEYSMPIERVTPK
jgi:tetratricopeptide (TPR) repeat protein